MKKLLSIFLLIAPAFVFAGPMLNTCTEPTKPLYCYNEIRKNDIYSCFQALKANQDNTKLNMCLQDYGNFWSERIGSIAECQRQYTEYTKLTEQYNECVKQNKIQQDDWDYNEKLRLQREEEAKKVQPIATPTPVVQQPIAQPVIVTQTVATSSKFTFTKNLKLGSTGKEVTELQKILKISPTGYFGSLTRATLIKFQKANNLPQTGTVGPMTRTILNK